ncbi:GGDEF domain-containing protein [Clostridiales bacterium]|nr:GGDEF domain-containing protein [Clostridiales bacterium]
MGAIRDRLSGAARHGIRLSRVNIVLLAVTVIGSIGIIIATNRLNSAYQQLIEETGKYINTQQDAGMIEEFSGSMLSESRSFLQTGDPAHVMAFYSQMDVIRRQLDGSGAAGAQGTAASDRYLEEAVEAFRTLAEQDAYAMRLKAETLPVSLGSYPAEFAGTEIRPEDAILDAEQKLAKAQEILDRTDYSAIRSRLSDRVDASHRAASETVQQQMGVTTARIRQELLLLRTFGVIFLVIAVLAMLSNLLLIILPINRSVSNLDNREEIPEQGSFEMRNLARVYNEVLRDSTEKQEELEYSATHDALTGVYNRAAFDREYDRCRNDRIGIAIVDVDGFKHYNDVYGHDVGDRVLRRVTETIGSKFRKEDHISRIGGDEFVIIMKNTGSAQSEDIKLKIDEINEELVKERRKGMPPISVSVGAAFWDRENPGPDILKDADKALLQMKQNGKLGCRIYGE